MTTTDKRRADALTAATLADARSALYGIAKTYDDSELRAKALEAYEATFAAPVELPAAAPIDGQICQHCGCIRPLHDLDCPVAIEAMKPAPSPADERAADAVAAFEAFASRYDHDSNEWLDMDAQQTFVHGWLAARAASANETGVDGLAHEVWAAAQLASGEGIEDGVQRIATILSRAPAQADVHDVPADDLVGFVYVLENPDRPHDPVTRFSRRPRGVKSFGAKIRSVTPVYSRPAQADGLPECNGSHDAGQIAAGDKE